MDSDEEIEIINKETLKDANNGVRFNITAIICFIVFYFIFQILRGRIDFENIYGNKYIPIDYTSKNFFENIYEKIINLKDFLIFFSILIVLFLFVHKSNLDWEREYVKKNPDIKKKLQKLETIIEENESELEKEKNE